MTAGLDRRAFLRRSAASCGAHLLAVCAAHPWLARAAFAERAGARIVAREPWGRLERVADGVWALISTPLEDRTTLCNGGIVRGPAGTLVIESFARPEGAAWMARQASALTGRWPDAVVLTHYHGDHANGLEGFVREDGGRPAVHATDATRQLVLRADARRELPPDPVRARILADALALPSDRATTLDLGGGRLVRCVPRDGHTASDVTVELDEPAVTFCGDLVWNAMFPNYMDAVPSHLSLAVRALARAGDAVFVPGHGGLSSADDLRVYTELLDDVEAAARRAHAAGNDAATAAREYRPPAGLGAWHLFSPRYYEVAIDAWLRELSAG